LSGEIAMFITLVKKKDACIQGLLSSLNCRRNMAPFTAR
jgi:hypothetical protein